MAGTSTSALVAVAIAAAAVLASAAVGGRPSGGPAAVVDHRRPAAAVPRPDAQPPEPGHVAAPGREPTGWGGRAPGSQARPPRSPRAPVLVWPLQPRPAVLRRFAPGPFPWSPGHRGIDLAASPGAEVLAAGAGVVAFAGQVAGRGVVSIAHRGGLRTTYEPVQAGVARGDPVAAGALVGRLSPGGSHCPPGACLHLGALVGDRYVDPLALLTGLPYPVLLPAPPPAQAQATAPAPAPAPAPG